MRRYTHTIPPSPLAEMKVETSFYIDVLFVVTAAADQRPITNDCIGHFFFYYYAIHQAVVAFIISFRNLVARYASRPISTITFIHMNVDGKLLLCSLGIYFSITSRAAGFLFYFFRVVVGVIGAKRKRNLIRQQT